MCDTSMALTGSDANADLARRIASAREQRQSLQHVSSPIAAPVSPLRPSYNSPHENDLSSISDQLAAIRQKSSSLRSSMQQAVPFTKTAPLTDEYQPGSSAGAESPMKTSTNTNPSETTSPSTLGGGVGIAHLHSSGHDSRPLTMSHLTTQFGDATYVLSDLGGGMDASASLSTGRTPHGYATAAPTEQTDDGTGAPAAMHTTEMQDLDKRIAAMRQRSARIRSELARANGPADTSGDNAAPTPGVPSTDAPMHDSLPQTTTHLQQTGNGVRRAGGSATQPAAVVAPAAAPTHHQLVPSARRLDDEVARLEAQVAAADADMHANKVTLERALQTVEKFEASVRDERERLEVARASAQRVADMRGNAKPKKAAVALSKSTSSIPTRKPWQCKSDRVKGSTSTVSLSKRTPRDGNAAAMAVRPAKARQPTQSLKLSASASPTVQQLSPQTAADAQPTHQPADVAGAEDASENSRQVERAPPLPNPVAFRVLHDYNPMEESPNPDPHLELALRANEIIHVVSELCADGFYMAQRTNVADGQPEQGLVAYTYLAPVDGAHPLHHDTPFSAAPTHSSVLESTPAQHDDEVFVVVDELSEAEKEQAEAHVDYVVVGRLTEKEARQAHLIATEQAERAKSAQAARPTSAQATESPRGRDSAARRVRSPAEKKAPPRNVHSPAKDDVADDDQGRRAAAERLRAARRPQGLARDAQISASLKDMQEKYSLTITHVPAKKVYGAAKAPTEKFEINGVETISVMRKSDLILVKDGNAWVPLRKYFRKYAPIERNPDSNGPPDLVEARRLEALVQSAQREAEIVAENYHSKVDVEKARVAFLKEQIAASKDYLHKETVEEDQLLVELQTQNADLQEQLLRKSHNATTSKDGDTSSLARSLPATLTSSVPLMHHTPNKIKRRLTIDEAISAATTKALDKHPDAIIRPTQTKSHGNFRTFLINGESVLMTQKGNRVIVRGKTEWYGLVEFISNQKQRLATESEKRERIEAGIKSKMEGKKLAASLIEQENKEQRYRRLALAYEKTKERCETTHKQGAMELAKTQRTVEELEQEMAQIDEIQRAARERRLELLEQMQKKNETLLSKLANAEEQVALEDKSMISANESQLSSTLEEKTTAVIEACNEYEGLKAVFEADIGGGYSTATLMDSSNDNSLDSSHASSCADNGAHVASSIPVLASGPDSPAAGTASSGSNNRRTKRNRNKKR